MTRWQWFQLISFQIIWLVAVLGRNQWIIVPIGILLVHLLISPSKSEDLKVLPLAIIGIVIDTTLILLGVLEFIQWPWWLGLLWMGFVLNFGHSLLYLRKLHVKWLIIIGATAGAYSYLVSSKLGAVELPMGVWMTGIIIACLWAGILPLLVNADQRLRKA